MDKVYDFLKSTLINQVNVWKKIDQKNIFKWKSSVLIENATHVCTILFKEPEYFWISRSTVIVDLYLLIFLQIARKNTKKKLYIEIIIRTTMIKEVESTPSYVDRILFFDSMKLNIAGSSTKSFQSTKRRTNILILFRNENFCFHLIRRGNAKKMFHYW